MRDIYLIGWNKNNPQRGAKNIAMEKTVQPKPRRGVKIIATDMTCASKPRRGARIIEMYMLHVPKPRRGVKIIESAIIGRQKPQRVAIIMEKPMFEHQKYHPSGVSIPHRDLCYNPTIPIGIENQTQWVDMIIEMDMTCAPKPRKVDKIIEKSMYEQQKYHPSGVSISHRDLCYNPTIRQKRIENKIHPLVENTLVNFITNNYN
jgi:hypothetical protein